MIERIEGRDTVPFDYADEFPGAWSDLIRELKEKGASRLRAHVFWGAHESVKGMRDFSKSSRLRLERFFSQAQANELKVELVLGFPTCRDAFPAWTMALKKKTWIPSALWSEADAGVSLSEVPSLFDEEFSSGLSDFFSELFSLAALYLAPEGPLDRVILDLGLYEADMNAVESGGFAQSMAARYPELDTINRNYQVSFKSFSALASRPALRALCDRRPWLAAFDYKWARRRLLDEIRESVARLASNSPLSDIFTAEERPPIYSSSSTLDWGLCLDGVAMEPFSHGRIFAFTPAGFINQPFVHSFRLGEYLAQRCASEKIPFDLLPVFKKDRELPRRRLSAVVCGKYLTQASYAAIRAFLEGGGKVFFPYGLPHYDQDMQTQDWLFSGEKSGISVGGYSLIRSKLGTGTVWYPSGEAGSDVVTDIWARIREISHSILEQGDQI